MVVKRTCCVCEKELPGSSFSKTQLNKGVDNSCCLKCVEKRSSAPARRAAAAASSSAYAAPAAAAISEPSSPTEPVTKQCAFCLQFGPENFFNGVQWRKAATHKNRTCKTCCECSPRERAAVQRGALAKRKEQEELEARGKRAKAYEELMRELATAPVVREDTLAEEKDEVEDDDDDDEGARWTRIETASAIAEFTVKFPDAKRRRKSALMTKRLCELRKRLPPHLARLPVLPLIVTLLARKEHAEQRQRVGMEWSQKLAAGERPPARPKPRSSSRPPTSSRLRRQYSCNSSDSSCDHMNLRASEQNPCFVETVYSRI